jgi:hypothetical protein
MTSLCINSWVASHRCFVKIRSEHDTAYKFLTVVKETVWLCLGSRDPCAYPRRKCPSCPSSWEPSATRTMYGTSTFSTGMRLAPSGCGAQALPWPVFSVRHLGRSDQVLLLPDLTYRTLHQFTMFGCLLASSTACLLAVLTLILERPGSCAQSRS